MSMFRFGCASLPHDESTQLAHYGARLIYNEVLAGFSGVVYNRQTADGPKEIVEQRIFPHMDDFMALLADHMEYGSYLNEPKIRFDNREVLAATFDDDVVIVASPQGSYGYLYLSAAVLKPEAAPSIPTDSDIDAEGMAMREGRIGRILDDEMSLL